MSKTANPADHLYYDIGNYKPNAQYNKLIIKAKEEVAFPIYLLFSGKTKKSYLGKGENGCSIIEAEKIKDYRLNQHKTKITSAIINPLVITKTPQITFKDLFPDLKPLHYLFCQKSIAGFNLPPGKTYKEIYKGFPYQRNTFSREINSNNLPEQPDQILTPDAITIINERSLAPIRIIINEEPGDNK